MEKVLEKSQKATVLKEIFELTTQNAEMYAMLKKISLKEQGVSLTLQEKLDSIWLDIKDRIRQLSNNIDLMYKMFDRKIGIMTQKMPFGVPEHLENELNFQNVKVKELEEEIDDLKAQYKTMKTQNEYLKNKNISLIEELEVMTKRKETTTNDSSRNINFKGDITQEHESIIQTNLSPFEQPNRQNLIRNDLTFNNPQSSPNKRIMKEEQSSFSSMIQEDEKRYEKERRSLRDPMTEYGCMPSRKMNENWDNKNRCEENVTNDDQSHRLNYLMVNLKNSSEKSFVSKTSRPEFDNEDSVNKSLFSKGIIKKYQI